MQNLCSDHNGLDPSLLSRLIFDQGMFAALDQSGGSTPSALAHYGVKTGQYQNDEEMFEKIHEMRLRIMKSPAFDGNRILAVILFRQTLESLIADQTIPNFLLEKHDILSFLKIDVGLEKTINGAQLMRPIPDLVQTLRWARNLGVVGTKMRTLIHAATEERLLEAVRQQFALADEVFKAGLLPIVEIEVSTALPLEVRHLQELRLRYLIQSALDETSSDLRVFVKLTIPVKAGCYKPLMTHPRVCRVLALSGGFSRGYACQQLAENPGMIASFSRALLEDLRIHMREAEFDHALDRTLSEVIRATPPGASYSERPGVLDR